jgi:hypothetical protein
MGYSQMILVPFNFLPEIDLLKYVIQSSCTKKEVTVKVMKFWSILAFMYTKIVREKFCLEYSIDPDLD